MSVRRMIVSIGHVRRRRHGEEGFALIATLLILAASTIIVLGLLSYTMTTISYAADQALRDQQVQAADGAMDTLVNQIANDTSRQLGAVGNACTPDLKTYDPTDPKSKFSYTINNTPVDVQCFPEESTGAKDPSQSDVPDVINVIGNGAARSANDCAGTTSAAAGTQAFDPTVFACADWSKALQAAGVASGQVAGKVAAVSTDGGAKSITHSGPGPLWFTANLLRTGSGASGVRDSSSCTASSSSDLCAAIGVTGTYAQGGVGVFKGLTADTKDNTQCGALQQESSVKAAQVVTRVPNRTVCGNTDLTSSLQAMGSDIVPGAPTDLAGDVVGTPVWVQKHRVTTLGRPDRAGAVGAAFYPNYIDASGKIIDGTTCPFGADRIISLLPGAYTSDIMGVISRWMAGGKYCRVSNGSQGITFWFQPGYYWFDMNDQDTGTMDPLVDAEVSNNETVNPFQIQLSGSKNFYIFGTPSVPLAQLTRFTQLPLCDATQAGVSVTLSERTSIRHVRGRAAICGITNKPAIYQGTTENHGWQTTVQTVKIGAAASKTTYVSDYSTGFGSIFDVNHYNKLPGYPQWNYPRAATVSNIDLQVGCSKGASLSTWDDPIIGGHCQNQTMVEIAGGTGWGTGTGPGHVPISSAPLEITGTTMNAEDDTWSPDPSTAIGVFLAGHEANATPDCAVYYKGLPNQGVPVAFDLLDPTKAGSATVPPCSSIIKYADQLYTSTVRVVMNSRSGNDCIFRCSTTVVSTGVSITNIRLSTGWEPSGTVIACGTGGSDYASQVVCRPKDGTTTGLLRSSTMDVIQNRKQAAVRLVCNPPSTVTVLVIFSYDHDECGPSNDKNTWVTKTLTYGINDRAAPDFASMTSATTGVRPVTSLAISLKGGSYCKKVRQFGGIGSFLDLLNFPKQAGWSDSCGPQTTSYTSDSTEAMDQLHIDDTNTPPYSSNFYAFKNWWRLASGSTVSASVVNSAGTELCKSADAPLAEHDETRVLKITTLGACATAANLVGATVKVNLKIRRGDFSDFNRYVYGCQNGDGDIGGSNDGNQCIEWGYNVDWIGVNAVTGSGTEAGAYDGPPRSNRVTQNFTSRYARNDASFNVYGQVVLPKSDLVVAWAGPSSGKPIIEGPAPGGQPTLVVRSIASVTAKIPADVSPIPDIALDSIPQVGVICCSKYHQNVRRVRIVARLTSAAKNNPNGLVGTALVEVVEASNKVHPIVNVLDWRLCNQRSGAAACGA